MRIGDIRNRLFVLSWIEACFLNLDIFPCTTNSIIQIEKILAARMAVAIGTNNDILAEISVCMVISSATNLVVGGTLIFKMQTILHHPRIIDDIALCLLILDEFRV